MSSLPLSAMSSSNSLHEPQQFDFNPPSLQSLQPQQQQQQLQEQKNVNSFQRPPSITTTAAPPSMHFNSPPKSPLYNSGSISGSFPGAFSGSFSGAIKTPSPTTPTFATSFPQTIKQQDPITLSNNMYDFIFDVRPFNLYSKSRIQQASNLSVPTTLLKRSSFSLGDLLNMVSLDSVLKDRLTTQLNNDCSSSSNSSGNNSSTNDKKLTLLFYDQATTKDAITFPLYQTISKFEKFSDKFDIYYLNGGFSKALLGNPQIVENTPLVFMTSGSGGLNNSSSNNNNNNQNQNGADNNHRKAKSLSGFTLPSATNFKSKFVQSIKKNNDYSRANTLGNGRVAPTKDSIKSYKYKLAHVPQDLTLPNWLTFMKTQSNEEIIKQLDEKFDKVEEIEKNRLNQMCSDFKKPLSSESGNNDDATASPLEHVLSPCCSTCSEIEFRLPRGIEFGYKNRYNNIWPYEHSRVKLSLAEQQQHQHQQQQQQQQLHNHNHVQAGDDYFNGNYISTNPIVENKQIYIATQNPLASTIDDFWSLINLEHIQIIINLDAKPVSYFNHPSIKNIECIKTNSPDFKLRRINNNIYHFHYLSWPDFGVPQSFKSIIELVKFKDELIKLQNLSQKIIVHCSAGCGRTGVFITIDALIQGFLADAEKIMSTQVDLVYKLVQHQRRQRISMVQTLDQFIVCYEVFIKYLELVKARAEVEANMAGNADAVDAFDFKVENEGHNDHSTQSMQMANILEFINNNVEEFTQRSSTNAHTPRDVSEGFNFGNGGVPTPAPSAVGERGDYFQFQSNSLPVSSR